MNAQALNAVYLFIAELAGYKVGTVEGKLAFGKNCFENNSLPEYTEENLPEYIWLERLYDELTKYYTFVGLGGDAAEFHWSVPIELDASALT